MPDLPIVQFCMLNENAYPLECAYENSAGYDVRASFSTTINANNRGLVPTGLKLRMPEGVYGRIAPRSGLAIHHFINTLGGVIDPNYTGEIFIIIANHSDTDFIVPQGLKIAQIIFEKYERVQFLQVNNIDANTERNERGFGSST